MLFKFRDWQNPAIESNIDNTSDIRAETHLFMHANAGLCPVAGRVWASRWMTSQGSVTAPGSFSSSPAVTAPSPSTWALQVPPSAGRSPPNPRASPSAWSTERAQTPRWSRPRSGHAHSSIRSASSSICVQMEDDVSVWSRMCYRKFFPARSEIVFLCSSELKVFDTFI